MQKQKGITTLTGIIIIVVVAVIIFGAFFVYQKYLNPTLWWKTYTDKDYGYGIKYPAGWQIDPVTNWIKNPQTGSYFYAIQATGIEYTSGGKTISIAGTQAYKKYSGLTPPGVYFEVTTLLNKNKTEFYIQGYSGSIKDDKTLEQILSTFKFTK